MNGISLNSSFKIGAVATALCSMVPTAYNVGSHCDQRRFRKKVSKLEKQMKDHTNETKKEFKETRKELNEHF